MTDPSLPERPHVHSGGAPRWTDASIVSEFPAGWRLLGSRCRACEARYFPRAYTCAQCLSADLEPAELSGHGIVQVSAVAHATQPGFFSPARYAWVDLPSDGVRVFAHLVPADGPEPLRGTPVDFCPVVAGSDADGPFCSIGFRLKGDPQ